jgi:hypothetical protein
VQGRRQAAQNCVEVSELACAGTPWRSLLTLLGPPAAICAALICLALGCMELSSCLMVFWTCLDFLFCEGRRRAAQSEWDVQLGRRRALNGVACGTLRPKVLSSMIFLLAAAAFLSFGAIAAGACCCCCCSFYC